MNEYEIWSLNNSGLIGNAMYIAGIVFLLWVALRAANQVRTENSNVSVKILVSLFSLGIIYNGLFTGAILINTVEGTAYLLSQLDSINAFSQSFVDTFNTCLLYTSPSPRDLSTSRMPSSA